MSETNYPAGITSFGVPLPGALNNIYGTYFFVDGTNGSDGNNGLSRDEAFATVQKAITTQGLFSTGLIDAIIVFPGTYVESLTGALTTVNLIGVGWTLVTIAPTISNAYTGAVTDSVVSGIQFLEPTAAATVTSAFSASSLRGSLIADCAFTGKTGTAESTGLRVGSDTSAASEAMFQSVITRNVFDASGGRTKEWGVGISIGPSNATTDAATRVFSYSEISFNQVWSEEVGIRVVTNAANGGGIIKNNILGSRQNTGGSGIGIGHAGDSTDILSKVIDNRINCGTDGIAGFTTGNVQGNIVSIDGNTPAAETA